MDSASHLSQEFPDPESDPPPRPAAVVASEIYNTPSPSERYGEEPRAITHTCRSRLQDAWRKRKAHEANDKSARELAQEQARRKEHARRERDARRHEERRLVMEARRYDGAWQQQAMRWAREALREGGATVLRRARTANTLLLARQSLAWDLRPNGGRLKRTRSVEDIWTEAETYGDRRRSVEEMWRDSEAELERGVIEDYTAGRSGMLQPWMMPPATMQPGMPPATMQPGTMQPAPIRWEGQRGKEGLWREREAEGERDVMENYRAVRSGAMPPATMQPWIMQSATTQPPTRPATMQAATTQSRRRQSRMLWERRAEEEWRERQGEGERGFVEGNRAAQSGIEYSGTTQRK